MAGVVSDGEGGCAGLRRWFASLQHQEKQGVQLQGFAQEFGASAVRDHIRHVQGRQEDSSADFGKRIRHGIWKLQHHSLISLGLFVDYVWNSGLCSSRIYTLVDMS